MRNFPFPLEVSLLLLALAAAPASSAPAGTPAAARLKLEQRRAEDVVARRNKLLGETLGAMGVSYGTGPGGVPVWIEVEGERLTVVRIEVAPVLRKDNGREIAGHEILIVTPKGVVVLANFPPAPAGNTPAAAPPSAAQLKLEQRRAEDVIARRNQLLGETLTAMGVPYGTGPGGAPVWVEVEGERLTVVRIEVAPVLRKDKGRETAGHEISIVTPKGVILLTNP